MPTVRELRASPSWWPATSRRFSNLVSQQPSTPSGAAGTGRPRRRLSPGHPFGGAAMTTLPVARPRAARDPRVARPRPARDPRVAAASRPATDARAAGFSLIELLLVCALVGIL
ncbi:MAG: prepilin-type N-terminal cleavage/methylation domain-containing protein, partial [Vicinamibacteraceae bacterium]|nr:prepilin-type N-terminal cleavage/methylation domain-containing protein [Vicinamibacteraceae bacterium]